MTDMVEVPRELLETLRGALADLDSMKCGHWAAIRAARAVIDAAVTPLHDARIQSATLVPEEDAFSPDCKIEDVVPHVCNAAHPDDCTKPDHPELTVTVFLCQSCGKQIGQSISAGTLDLSDFNPATPVAEFTEELPDA